MNQSPGHAHGNPDAVIGRRTVMNSIPTSGGLFIPSATQLLSVRVNTPRQWVVTMMQPVTQRSGVNPWISTFDGHATYPAAAPDVFTAPQWGVGAIAQIALRWGAGGVAFETRCDYPAAGGVFGLTADVVDLSVVTRGTPTAQSSALLPVIGAFMVPGQAADPIPLRWLEYPQVNMLESSSIYYAVKPFARRVAVEVNKGTGAAEIGVVWLDSVGTYSIWDHSEAVAANESYYRVLDVPAAATVLRITNGDGAQARVASVEWQMGLV